MPATYSLESSVMKVNIYTNPAQTALVICFTLGIKIMEYGSLHTWKGGPPANLCKHNFIKEDVADMPEQIQIPKMDSIFIHINNDTF